ncbi:Ger(x)C family spore germination protein [Anaerosolibacter sp.]|uniref:Ger(x)C family spore germination protein n=1 Tax=Anaerosolibacter sp. TaxID=1872527 RepID=UPI0039EF8CF7
MPYKVLLLFLCSLFLTGCWDNVEVQDRNYVFAIAIDKAPPTPKGLESMEDYRMERDIEKMPLEQGKVDYAYTINLPIFTFANLPGGQAGGSEEDPSWDLTLAGNSFMEVNREFSTRMSNPAFYEHLQTIVISEEVAREGISKPLDLFLRDHEMRRRMRIFVVPGDAKKFLNVKPRIESFPALYLSEIPENAEINPRMVHIADLGEVSESLHTKRDFVLPRAIATKDEVKVAGCAIFKGDKMVGWLGEIDTAYMKWIRNYVEGGIIVIQDPDDHKGLINLEVTKAKVKVRPIVNEEGIKMAIDVKASFNLVEKYETHYKSALDEDYIKILEKAAEDHMKNQMKDTIQYVQRNFGADIFYFDVQMRRYQPDVWDEVKDQWDDIFKRLDTEITVQASVKQIGTMK